MGLVNTSGFLFRCFSMMAFSIFVNVAIGQTIMVDVCFTYGYSGERAEWCTSGFLICFSGSINITSGQEFTHYAGPNRASCGYSKCSTNGDLRPDSILITQIATACNGLRNCSINNTVDIQLPIGNGGYVHVNYTCVQDSVNTVRQPTVKEDSYFSTTSTTLTTTLQPPRPDIITANHLSTHKHSPESTNNAAVLTNTNTSPGNGDLKLTTVVVPVVVSVLAVLTVIVVAIAYKSGLCGRLFTLLRRENLPKDASQDASGMELPYEDLRCGSGSDAADYSDIDSTQGENNRYYNINEVYYNA